MRLQGFLKNFVTKFRASRSGFFGVYYKLQMTIELEIQKLTYGGKGIGRINGKVVFVPYSAPGDVVEAELTAEKKGFSEGVITRIIRPSEFRVSPPCPVYSSCGGCAMQHIAYAEQVRCKQTALAETLQRIGKLKDVPFEAPIAATEQFNYRTRARFHADGNMFGFYKTASHDIVEIEDCPLVDKRLNKAIAPIKAFVKRANGKKNAISSVELSLMSGDSIAAIFTINNREKIDPSGLFNELRSLAGFETRDANTGKLFERRGETILTYEALGNSYKAPVNSFTQSNRLLNPGLIEKTLEYAGLDKTKRVIDLYCGAGNITIPAAKIAKEAVGVENSKTSVKFAEINAAANHIDNVRFIASDVTRWLDAASRRIKDIKTLERRHGDVVILDPPRDGDIDAARRISLMQPETIVYVSCAPPTLARDLNELAGNNYRVFSAVLIDMFPQTYHIECIVGLKRE